MTPSLSYLSPWPRLAAALVNLALYVVFLIHVAVMDALMGWDIPEGPFFGLSAIAQFAYNAALGHWYGGTLGHLAVQGRIVHHRTGQRIGPVRSAARAVLGALDLLWAPMFINGMLLLTREDRRHFYDLLTGTAAVDRPAHPNGAPPPNDGAA